MKSFKWAVIFSVSLLSSNQAYAQSVNDSPALIDTCMALLKDFNARVSALKQRDVVEKAEVKKTADLLRADVSAIYKEYAEKNPAVIQAAKDYEKDLATFRVVKMDPKAKEQIFTRLKKNYEARLNAEDSEGHVAAVAFAQKLKANSLKLTPAALNYIGMERADNKQVYHPEMHLIDDKALMVVLFRGPSGGKGNLTIDLATGEFVSPKGNLYIGYSVDEFKTGGAFDELKKLEEEEGEGARVCSAVLKRNGKSCQ